MTYLCFALIALTAVSATHFDLLDDEHIVMTLEKCKNCDDFPNGKIRLENIVIDELGRNKMALSGTLDMEVPLTEHFKMKVSLTKCPSKMELGICEDFPPTMINDFCKKLPQDDQLWSDFVADLENFNPHCPVPKGHYKFHRLPVDINSLANVPIMEGYWKMKCEGYIQGERVMCEQIDMIFSLKKKNKRRQG